MVVGIQIYAMATGFTPIWFVIIELILLFAYIQHKGGI